MSDIGKLNVNGIKILNQVQQVVLDYLNEHTTTLEDELGALFDTFNEMNEINSGEHHELIMENLEEEGLSGVHEGYVQFVLLELVSRRIEQQKQDLIKVLSQDEKFNQTNIH